MQRNSIYQSTLGKLITAHYEQKSLVSPYKISSYPSKFMMIFFTHRPQIMLFYLCTKMTLFSHFTPLLHKPYDLPVNKPGFYFLMVHHCKTTFHFCTFSLITARFVHHYTLKQALLSISHYLYGNR